MKPSRTTTASVMRSLNIQFNIWESHPSDPGLVDYWQEQLGLAGVTDDNAKALLRWFVSTWASERSPTLQHVCRRIKEEVARRASVGAGSAAATSPKEREEELAGERGFLAGAEGTAMLRRMRERLEAARGKARRGETVAVAVDDVPDDEIPF